jgi:hypothetical protein
MSSNDMPHIAKTTFDENYNFVVELTSIESLYNKLWAFKVARVPISRISRLPTWNLEKMTFGCNPHGQSQIIL